MGLLDRRAFVGGLGALFAAQGPRVALANPGGGFDDIRVRIVDTAFDLTSRAAAMRRAGIRTVIRYYAHGTGQWTGKVISKSELDALEAHGLSVAVVFQNNNNVPDNFLDPNKKVEDVAWARRHADALRQPAGTPIYFGADFDLRHWDGKKGKSDPSATSQRVAAVRSYFEYAHDELAKDGRTIGVYGCGRTLELLEDVADYFWLSASVDYWRSGEFYNSGKWHLYQNRVDLTRTYGDAKPCPIDTNLANPAYEEFGQWRRDGRPVVETKAATQRVLDARSFVAVQQLCLTKDHPSRDGSGLRVEALAPSEQRALRYAISVKVLREEGGHCAVSLDEGDTIRAWCRKADLSADGRMPLRANRKHASSTTCTPDPEAARVAAAPAEPRKPSFTTAAAKSRPVTLPARPTPTATAAAAPATSAAAAPAAAAPKVGALTPSAHGIN